MSPDQYPKPVTDPEAEGLPDYADDDSFADPERATSRVADGPEPAALPSDHPLAVDDFGTTATEQLEGEPLEDRLSREEPDIQPEEPRPAVDPVDEAEAEWESGEVPPLDELDTNRDEGAVGAPDRRGVLDPAAPADAFTEMDADPPAPEDDLSIDEARPDPDSEVSLYDLEAEGPVGRLVAPDEGAHADEEKDEVATDRGVSGGGASPEELAIHEILD
jgi:hypothetical protein